MVILKSVQWAPLLPILLILGVCVCVCVFCQKNYLRVASDFCFFSVGEGVI